jgi:hypothetical protein
MLTSYLKQIFEITDQGDAREESYYATLERLFNEFAKSSGKNHIHITTLPKQTEAGNPDFRVWDGKQHVVGYIEAKAPTTEDLRTVEDSEQLKRYRHTFPNLILTNFFEFRLYRNGELVEKVSIGRPFILHKLKRIPPVEKEPDFLKLLETFFSFSLPKVYNAKSLAIELAKRTRFLKDEIVTQELKQEEAALQRTGGQAGKGFILGFYEAFSRFLISGLSREDFADLYSQTITYGLFVARTRSENSFNRKLAYDNIPRTIGILRDVFQFISLGDLPLQMEWIIDDIAEVLAVADVNKLLRQYFREGKGKDPIIHFYETFLSEYDPKTREKRGVYYTPEPVVSYIVRSLHHILKDRFDRSEGFASNSVTILDPAGGTLTFLSEAAKLAAEEFASKYGEGAKEHFIKEHVLENFYAFELMMAPYAVGHLKMSFLLEEIGYHLKTDDRFKLYLTNTLEMEELAQTELPGMASLSEESHLAGKVKKEQPILVILGNPPYSGHSANQGPWIDKLLKKGYTHSNGLKDDGYYRVDGKPLGEKNPKWLQDDYVKFIRFAQWKIDQAGEGVLGFITSHSYLDNPTFRGMRQSLMQSFNDIYILDLHGNSLKKERCPDGSKDENVFDIRQGTAIALFIKQSAKEPRFQPGGLTGRRADKQDKNEDQNVFHSDLWGTRDKKYEWLLGNDITSTDWQSLTPKSEFYLYIPRDEKLLERYEKAPKITDIFPVNSVGIVTARDKLTIHWTPEKVWKTVLNFSKMDDVVARLTYNLGKDVRDWKVELAQKDLIDSGLDREKIVPILYRPFDIRFTYYTGRSRGFHCMPRKKVMHHMQQENLGLIIPKRVETKIPWSHILCSNEIVEHVAVSLKTIDYVFPLYTHPDEDHKNLFSHLESAKGRQPNINPKLFSALIKAYQNKPIPEDIFYYIYAVLYANEYRTKYAEFLRIDFPRVPFTKHFELFQKMGAFGKHLAELHLMKSTELDPPLAKFQGTGMNRVDTLKFNQKNSRMYINKDQYFEGIEKAVWEYQIGGYQVCHKWLKDRKGRVLSLEEIKHYCKVVTAIKKTIETQKDIDAVYPETEKELIEF